MTRFGLGIGLAVVVGLSAWGIAHGTENNPASAAEAAAVSEDDDSTHDDAVHRHRTNQSTHWRHVMVGRR